MSTLCSNIKNSGVTIYAVQIDSGGAGQSALLPACASNANNFLHADAAVSDRHRVPADRRREREAARREIIPVEFPANKKARR